MSKTFPLAATLSLVVVACQAPGMLQGFRISAVKPVYTAFPAVSGQPGDWKDATQDVSPVPSWLYPGKWYLLPFVSGFSGGVYHEDEEGAFPHVSIRRYSGTMFGTDGNLPDHYKVSVAVQPFYMASWQPPVGENGILVYYKNPTNYVELVIGNTNVAVWSATNASPTGSAGWKGHYWYGYTTKPADIRRVSAEINTHTKQLTYWVEGQKAATLTLPMLTNGAPHGFALRSIGNKINFGELKIESYSAVTSPSPTPTPTPTSTSTPTPEPTPLPTSSTSWPSGFQSYGNLPTPVVWHRAAEKNGMVYVSGGTNGMQSFTSVSSSPIGSSWAWTSRTSLPLPTEGHGFVIIGNHAFVVGGWGRGSSPRASVYKAVINADGSLGGWQATTPLPSGRAFAAVVAQGNQIVVMGGWNPSYGATNTVYTATANADGSLSGWSQAPSLPANRVWGAACASNGQLTFSGGGTGSQTQSSVYQANYSNGIIGIWQAVASLPQPLEGHGMMLVNGLPTTFGGDNYINGVPNPTANNYQLVNGSWQPMTPLPAPRFAQAMVGYGGWYYLMGGHGTNHSVLSGIWRGVP